MPVGAGTLVGFSPEDGSKDPFVTYIDGESDKATTRVSPYGATSTAAVCGERVFSSGRGTDTKAFEDDSESIPENQLDRAALTSAYPHDGTDILSTLEPSGFPGTTSPCVDGIVYEGWENDDGQHFVRVWDTTKGTPAAQVAVDHEIVYPEGDAPLIGGPDRVKVLDGRLFWVVDNAMWSAPLPTGAEPIRAREVGYLEGSVGLDAEVLAYSSNDVYTVTNESDLHERFSRRRSDRVWTELTELSLVRTDLASGKPSPALKVDVKDVDFPTKDASVTALAINPEWLAENGESVKARRCRADHHATRPSKERPGGARVARVTPYLSISGTFTVERTLFMRTPTTVRTCRLAAAGLSLGLALALTACGSEDTKTDADAAVEAESSAPVSESESASAAPAGAEAEVKIGKTLKDPDTGDTIEVISAVRDFPSTEEADLIAEGGEVVLLQVKIKPGKEFGGSVSYSNFDISADGGTDFDSADSQLEEELTAAKRTPLDSVRRMEGGEPTGWIAYTVDEKADTYLVEYERSAAKVIGSDKEIPEFKEQIEIPAS